jgi:hypothetical protein
MSQGLLKSLANERSYPQPNVARGPCPIVLTPQPTKAHSIHCDTLLPMSGLWGRLGAICILLVLAVSSCGHPPSSEPAGPVPAETSPPGLSVDTPRSDSADTASPSVPTSDSTSDVSPFTPPVAGGEEQPVRLGCGTYCHNAGGYGGSDFDAPKLTEVEMDHPVVLRDDGTVPVRVSCQFDTNCAGAILLGRTDVVEDGRCDLFVRARQSRLIAVPVPDSAVVALQEEGRITLSLTVDSLPTVEQLPNRHWDDFDGLTTASVEVVSP